MKILFARESISNLFVYPLGDNNTRFVYVEEGTGYLFFTRYDSPQNKFIIAMRSQDYYPVIRLYE